MDIKNTNLNKMPDGYKLNKWVLLLSGALFTFIGIYFFGSPANAFFAMILSLGFIKTFSGITEILTSLSKVNKAEKWGLITGIIDVTFGIVLLSSKFFQTAIILVSPFIIAAWALCRGTIMLIKSLKIRKIYNFWLFSFIIGLLAIFFAFAMLSSPYSSLIGFIDAICFLLIFMGISLIIQFLLLLFTDR